MKLKVLLILILLVLPVVGISLVVNPMAPPNPYYLGVSRPPVIAHQGGDGVWPGDTMYAFEQAVGIGIFPS